MLNRKRVAEREHLVGYEAALHHDVAAKGAPPIAGDVQKALVILVGAVAVLDTPHHGLACLVELDEAGEPVMWRIENSHGANEDYQGFLHITRDWWRAFGGDIVVERRFVPDEVLALRDTLPVEHRDPWDGFINYRPW